VNLLRHTASSQAIAVLAAASLTATLLGGCGDANGKTASDKSPEAVPTVPVEIATPKVAEMLAVYSGTAAINADRAAIVMPKITAEIRQVLVEEGDHVRAGQVLARLVGDLFEADRCCQSRGSGTDDNNVVVHGLAGGQGVGARCHLDDLPFGSWFGTGLSWVTSSPTGLQNPRASPPVSSESVAFSAVFVSRLDGC